ncbi:RsiV family protein [uncultured Aquimarina sp.]|uniref:RsiV family protein n=1 Tax=uncultured Aquimarina sp. TaxID=575652 RepID=UPI0026153E32|nr:RsiV family protein [uncultured Aquimarina sp.]
MKNLICISLITILMSCNTISNDSNHQLIEQDSKPFLISHNFSKEKSGYWLEKKEKASLNDFVSTKKFYKEENSLILDYKYPYLDEQMNPLFHNFNSFIEKNYLKTEMSILQVLQNDDLSCDPLFKDVERKRRNLDYKVYTKNNQFLSILLYKTNYYDADLHNSFMFKGLNYNVQTGMFITYDDLFENKSEEFLLFKLNQELQARIVGQDSFNDCWEFTKDTFEVFKNNFVVDSDHIKFYFDDCAVCPSYAGNYFLEIPIEELSSILRVENSEVPYYKS